MGFPSPRTFLLSGVPLLVAVGCGFVPPLGDDKALSIQRFIAVPSEVTQGAPTILSWDVEGADSVELDNGLGLVPAKGSRTVHPIASTTYRLVAVAGTSLATSSLRVVVAPLAPSPSPSPSPSPTPEPSPTPAASPTPNPSPSPSPPPAG
jgi:hypothetical protein